jgi:3-oxoacyl-[acyl-carrier protein] reductase
VAGQAVLLTGAAGGIAPAVASALEADGWSVATTDLTGDVTVTADLADPAAPARVVEAAERALGPLGALVTCHAVSELGGLLDADAAQIDRHLAANVRGTLLLMQAFVRAFRGEAGTGRIVNFTSNPPLLGEIAYAASKGAIEWLTKSAAVELGPRGITVNAVDPGPTDTGWMDDELKARVEQATPLGRAGRPEDAAALVAFLCSPRGAWITGQMLHSDGGFASYGTPRRGGEAIH